MKVLFLDIDGVLNYKGCKEMFYSPRTGARVLGICKDRVKLLNEVVEKTGVHIVLSSTWRKLFPLNDLRYYFREQGLNGDNIFDTTPVIGGPRGDEVKAWLNRWPEVTKHAIVDDDADFSPDQPLVRTSFRRRGLRRVHVNKLVELLS